MIIGHNLAALNSYRNLSVNNAKTAKTLEKLSSGYKINRAADDAAGLAISEKMRGQIRGLSMAAVNVSHGVSLIQTAEGGLQEIQSVLQRMRELSVQAANGTYRDEDDREALDKEFESMKEEITRIAEYTHFNGIHMLDKAAAVVDAVQAEGTAVGPPVRVPPFVSTDTWIPGSGDVVGLYDLKIAGGDQLDIAYFNFSATPSDYEATEFYFGFNFYTGSTFGKGDPPGQPISLVFTAPNGEEFRITSNPLSAPYESTANIPGFGFMQFTWTNEADNTSLLALIFPGQYVSGGVAASMTDRDPAYNGEWLISVDNTGNKEVIDFGFAYNAVLDTGEGYFDAGFFDYEKAPPAAEGKGAAEDIILQIGANGSADQRLKIDIFNMRAANLGLPGRSVQDASISTREKANEAMITLDSAINQVSETRAYYGAAQNRLEHTLDNLGVTKENLQAAESSIRDIDMANAMMEFTKNNVIAQAAQAMLAQANQLPQGVLSLLR